MNFLGRSGAEAEQKRSSIKIVRTSHCTENKIELGILEKICLFFLEEGGLKGWDFMRGERSFFSALIFLPNWPIQISVEYLIKYSARFYFILTERRGVEKMKYELTQDLLTGNKLIDQEHQQLFDAINVLFDACAQGKGRDQLVETADFLNLYVNRHFGDEEKLQVSAAYPFYETHKNFHENYKKKLQETTRELLATGPSVKILASLNQVVGILVSHIKIEDRKLAKYLQEKG